MDSPVRVIRVYSCKFVVLNLRLCVLASERNTQALILSVMPATRPYTSGERHLLAVILGTLPAILVGFYVGLSTSAIGSNRELGPVLLRAACFAAPPAALAFLLPRFWIFPVLIYGLFFTLGYGFYESFGAAPKALMILFLRAFGENTTSTPPIPVTHELIWFYGIGLWAAWFASFSRRNYWRELLLSDSA
jgi:hypothetical protein